MPQERFLKTRGIRVRGRGHMPHWETNDVSYFVTFRLRDSLPAEVVARLQHLRAKLLARATTAVERREAHRMFGQRLDAVLDAGQGSGILREHGGVVADALRHFDGERYELQAWCVMPNHVHVLLYVPGLAKLDRIVHSWKSYSAHRIGRGVIWAREYFDHIVRGPTELERISEYIRANPSKAKLKGWPFVG
jgi:REP element-mobilizing transposase RayT